MIFWDDFERYLIDVGCEVDLVQWLRSAGTDLANIYRRLVREKNPAYVTINGGVTAQRCNHEQIQSSTSTTACGIVRGDGAGTDHYPAAWEKGSASGDVFPTKDG